MMLKKSIRFFQLTWEKINVLLIISTNYERTSYGSFKKISTIIIDGLWNHGNAVKNYGQWIVIWQTLF